MPVICPNCATPSDFRTPIGPAGRLVRCRNCGTSWLARVIDEDRFERRGQVPAMGGDRLSRRLPAPAIGEPAEVSEAIVIEHVDGAYSPTPRRQRPEPPPPARDHRALKYLGVALAVIVAILVARVPFGEALPQLQPLPDDVANLEFQRVRSETVELRGVSTLFVEGEIVNHSGRDVTLPAVRISLRSADGAEVSAWLVEPAADGLAAGRSIGFRSALASPPTSATQVTLKLAAREGNTIGMR